MSEPKSALKAGRRLPELVSARGLAAAWIVLAHTLAKTIEGYAPLPAAIEYSRVVVDFVFVLSGFVLVVGERPGRRIAAALLLGAPKPARSASAEKGAA